MKKYGLLLSLLTFIYSVQVFGKTLTICIEPKDVYPLYRGKGQEKKKFPGLYLEMVSMLKKKLGVGVKIRRQPFKRCLRSLKGGRVDAVASASYKDYRKEFGNYPFVKGKLQKEWRISASSYYLYSSKLAPPLWDGKAFKKNPGRIGAVRGYSIVNDLKNHKVEATEVSKIEQAFTMLSRKRLVAVAAHENDGDQFLKKGSFKKSALPLASKDYFLLLSHKLNKGFSQKIWKGLAEIRESESFKKIKEEYLRKGKW